MVSLALEGLLTSRVAFLSPGGINHWPLMGMSLRELFSWDMEGLPFYQSLGLIGLCLLPGVVTSTHPPQRLGYSKALVY